VKNTRPIYIVLGGSVLLTVLFYIVFFFLYISSEIDALIALTIPFLIGSFTFITFYFLIRIFIAEKLKILYRSIRKGKYRADFVSSFSMTENVIEVAEKETKEWVEQKSKEIARLKEQEEYRREFLGNLAHELKTPVFSIQGYILTLLDGGLEDESVNRSFLERASKATERMTLILEDLDDISKMEVNQIKLDLTSFDMTELVKDVFESLEFKAKEKNIQLVLAKKFDPVWVLADRSRINQVLVNLIHNSINYGNEGGTTTIRFYTMNDIVTVEVSDNGMGIEEKDVSRLFERFYRVEKSRNRVKGGTGLGLSIVKHIIEQHGQTINVRSTVNVGSTFTFSLDKGKR